MRARFVRLPDALAERLRLAAETSGAPEAALLRGALADALDWIEGHAAGDRLAAVAQIARRGAIERNQPVASVTAR